MKKLKKWLIAFSIVFGLIVLLLLGQWNSDIGIKTRMKRRKIRMKDLKAKESQLKKKIKEIDGDVIELDTELKMLRKEKSSIKRATKLEIDNASSEDKAKLLAELLKDL